MKKLSQLPVFKQLWSTIRQRKILAKHQKVVAFWKPVIEEYEEGKLPKYIVSAKKALDTDKIIWQYWGQGFQDETAPEIVSICAASVDRYKGDYTTIRLDDASIKEYIELPDFVWEKLSSTPGFGRTFFSDLLRVALLKTYGGIWFDATIFLTAPLPDYLEQYPYFLYQRDPSEQYQKYWESTYAYYWSWHPDFKVQMLSSVIFAKQQTEVITALLDLMFYYWQSQDKLIDYFCFQILYQELVTGMLTDQRCPVVSDVIPHLLQTKLNGGCDFVSYEEILAMSGIHKMSYFKEETMIKLRKLMADNKI